MIRIFNKVPPVSRLVVVTKGVICECVAMIVCVSGTAGLFALDDNTQVLFVCYFSLPSRRIIDHLDDLTN